MGKKKIILAIAVVILLTIIAMVINNLSYKKQANYSKDNSRINSIAKDDLKDNYTNSDMESDTLILYNGDSDKYSMSDSGEETEGETYVPEGFYDYYIYFTNAQHIFNGTLKSDAVFNLKKETQRFLEDNLNEKINELVVIDSSIYSYNNKMSFICALNDEKNHYIKIMYDSFSNKFAFKFVSYKKRQPLSIRNESIESYEVNYPKSNNVDIEKVNELYDIIYDYYYNIGLMKFELAYKEVERNKQKEDIKKFHYHFEEFKEDCIMLRTELKMKTKDFIEPVILNYFEENDYYLVKIKLSYKNNTLSKWITIYKNATAPMLKIFEEDIKCYRLWKSRYQ